MKTNILTLLLLLALPTLVSAKVTEQSYEAKYLKLVAAVKEQNELNKFNRSVQSKLQHEAVSLKNDLEKAVLEISALQRDKQAIQQNIKNLQDWGTKQQELATKYYNETQEVRKELVVIKEDLAKERADKAKLIAKYHKIKIIMGIIAGFCTLVIYSRAGTAYTGGIISMAGPWAIAVQIGLYVAAFLVGFLAIFIGF